MLPKDSFFSQLLKSFMLKMIQNISKITLYWDRIHANHDYFVPKALSHIDFSRHYNALYIAVHEKINKNFAIML